MDILDLNFYSVSRTLLFFTVVGLLISLEYFFSLHRIGKAGFRKRRLLNWYLGIINISIVIPISTLGMAFYCEYYKIGLFYYFNLHWVLVFLIWFLVYDAYVFLFHRVMHLGIFWKVHKVHHTESSLNLTTTYRIHPLELLALTVLKVGLILVLGPYLFVLLLSDLIQTLIVFFAHSNIKLNTTFERFLSQLIVTPRYHLMHHVEQCNQNYTVGLTFWDKLAGTFTEPIWTTSDLNQLKLGLPKIGKYDRLLDLLLISEFRSFIKNSRFLELKYSFFVIGGMAAFWLITLEFSGLTHGLIGINWVYYLLYLIVSLHLTFVTISIYLHRSETHRAVNFHPVVRHFFRFWLWLFTGTDRKEWVAVHRVHHQNPDKEQDPHSPVIYGIKKLFTHGDELYNNAKTPENVNKYGCITDVDLIEKRLYGSYNTMGPIVLLLIQVILVGIWAIPLWTIQMALQIIIQTTVINGFGHLIGYRNFNTPDNSHNITKWGILISGEELHNNHHESPGSAKFSYLPTEFDIGWFYICLLKKLGLATIRLKPVAIMDLKYKNSRVHT